MRAKITISKVKAVAIYCINMPEVIMTAEFLHGSKVIFSLKE